MTEDQKNLLAEALRTLPDYHSSAIYLEPLLEVLAALRDHTAAAPAHQRFREVCNLMDLAFPRGDPSDEEIRANPLTAPFFRYALAALRFYHNEVLILEAAGKKELQSIKTEEIEKRTMSHGDRPAKRPRLKQVTTPDRRELLGRAMGLDGQVRGGNKRAPPWSLENEMDTLTHFTGQLERYATHPERWKAAYLGTYEFTFGSDDEVDRKPKTVHENHVRLLRLLHQHGYGRWVLEALSS